MRIQWLLIGIVVFLMMGCTTSSHEFPKGEWVDLTYDFSSETIYWVTAEPFTRTTVAEGRTPGGYYYSAYNFAGQNTVEHTSTLLSTLPRAKRPSINFSLAI
jgi:hypothetical protein